MEILNKVVWEDGMFIYPQHLQQQELYFESLIHKYRKSTPYYFGIIDLKIDLQALERKKIIFTKLSGFLPNGSFFDINSNANILSPLEILNEDDEQFIYVGFIENNLISNELKKNSRYITDIKNTKDLFTDDDSQERKIKVCKINLQILSSNEFKKNLENFCTIPVLKIKKAQDFISIDQDFIPPCLYICKSQILNDYLKDVIMQISKYIESKVQELKVNNIILNNPLEILLLQTFNQFRYKFLLIKEQSFSHPYDLFKVTVDFISQIIIFTPNRSDDFSIKYDHNNLYFCFEKLNYLLHQVIQYFCKEGKYKKIDCILKNGIYCASIGDQCHGIKKLILQIVFSKTNVDINLDSFVKNVKIATQDDIQEIILAQITGLSAFLIKELDDLPHGDNLIYLNLDLNSYVWRKIKEQKNIAIYVCESSLEIQSMTLLSTK